MGEVWAARAEKNGTMFALKFLHPMLAQQPTLLRRTQREAEALSRISHPNVVQLHETLLVADLLVLVLELVRGGSLQDVVAESGTLPPPRVKDLLLGVLAGLGAVHRAGYVHRDIKPANILLDDQGRPKITDLGIAHDSIAKMTATGSVLGTLAYMSPEQVTRQPGTHLTPAADIYAVGIVGYELLSGRLPFLHSTDFEVMRAHLEQPPDLSQLPPNTPPVLRAAIAVALRKKPEQRFQSAQEMATALTATDPQELTGTEATRWDADGAQPNHLEKLGTARTIATSPDQTGDARRAAQRPGSILQERYEIQDELGRGSFGVTWRALDRKTGKQVAVKQLMLWRQHDWKALQLFEREANTLKRLEHPGIPRYVEYFEQELPEGPAFFLVQELAPGLTLRGALQGGWKPAEKEVIDVARVLLGMLEYLGTERPPVVHRDLKPDNILRSETGRLALVDFGSVRDVANTNQAHGSTVAGTVGYMGPEQLRGQSTPASDLHGLAATLLFLLTGRDPVDLPQKRGRLDVKAAVAVSRPFERWLKKMLEPEPADRFGSAAEARQALDAQSPGVKPLVLWLGVTALIALFAGVPLTVGGVVVVRGLVAGDSSGAGGDPGGRSLDGPKQGLVAHWSFDNDNARDSSGNGFDLLTGDVSFVPGRVGRAMSLRGNASSRAIGAPDPPLSECKRPLGIDSLPVSISTWLKLDASVGKEWQAVFSTDHSYDYCGVWLHVSRFGGRKFRVIFHLGDAGGGGEDHHRGLTSQPVIVEERWTHLAAVMGSLSDMKIYVDGSEAPIAKRYGRARQMRPEDPPGCPAIGWWEGSGSRTHFFKGELDELRVYARRLSAAEVAALANP